MTPLISLACLAGSGVEIQLFPLCVNIAFIVAVSTADGASRGYHRRLYTLNQTKRPWTEVGGKAFACWASIHRLAHARLLAAIVV